MKIKESLTDDLKSKMSSEFGKNSGGGVERLVAQNSFTKSLGENKGKNKKEQVIKRQIKKGVSNKLVGTAKLDKPINGMYTSIGGESMEATGSGSAGSTEGLFSVTKKEMEEMKETTFKAPKLTMFSDEVPKKVEAKEGTGSASSGSYVTTAAWAKSTNKKDWRGKSKTQIPGGKFVQVKEKCKKFPYCNQGDIKSLKIFEDETFKKVIKNISEKHGINENVIKSILSYEYSNVK
jgi:hypothetical protein